MLKTNFKLKKKLTSKDKLIEEINDMLNKGNLSYRQLDLLQRIQREFLKRK